MARTLMGDVDIKDGLISIYFSILAITSTMNIIFRKMGVRACFCLLADLGKGVVGRH